MTFKSDLKILTLELRKIDNVRKSKVMGSLRIKYFLHAT